MQFCVFCIIFFFSIIVDSTMSTLSNFVYFISQAVGSNPRWLLFIFVHLCLDKCTFVGLRNYCVVGMLGYHYFCVCCVELSLLMCEVVVFPVV